MPFRWSLSWLASLALGSALAMPVGADEAETVSADELLRQNVDTTVGAWLHPETAAVGSSSWTMDLVAIRRLGKAQDVLAVLATLRQFVEEHGERRERVLRVYVSDGEAATLVREYRLGDPEAYVALLGLGDLDGDEGVEVALSYASGGSAAGLDVEIFDPFDGRTGRPECVAHSDEGATLLDVDRDGVLELVVTRFMAGRTSPRCNAERVFLEEVLEYRGGSLCHANRNAAEFYRGRLTQVETTIAAAKTSCTASRYFLEAQEVRAASLRARADVR
jgi:hypothetical protein